MRAKYLFLALFFSGVGLVPSAPAQSWTWIQDQHLIFCVGPAAGCTITTGEMAPTTAGSVWILHVHTPNNVTITGVSGGGGNWVCGVGAHAFNSAGSNNTDACYNLSGNAGTSGGISFTLSGSSGNYVSANFIEILPPAGSTASFDAAGSATASGCTTCTAASLNITATDFIWQSPGGASAVDWKAWSSPYITDYNGSGVAINATSGAAPTVNYSSSSNAAWSALAFKSSLGTFTPPPHTYSIANYTATSATCGNCTLIIPSTGAGHLLVVQTASQNGTSITSVSGGGTWTVPSGTNTCRMSGAIKGISSAQASCAYNLSSSAGTTSVTVTMSGSVATSFDVWEIANSTGAPFQLDTQGSAYLSTTAYYDNGVSLNTTGNNDVVFQTAWVEGGSLGPTLYPQPQINFNSQQNVGPGNYIMFNEYSSTVLLDSGSSVPVPVWTNPQHDNVFVTAIAFTAAGQSAVNPPSGLTAVVH